jgi:ABC-type glycerol-3-phosphate transport system permease component
VLPLLAPALVSLGIIVFTWAWGAFLWPLVVVQDRNLYVLSVGLSVQPYNREPTWAAAMAASTVATLPIACLFIFLQRYFIKGLTAAAVKG